MEVQTEARRRLQQKERNGSVSSAAPSASVCTSVTYVEL